MNQVLSLLSSLAVYWGFAAAVLWAPVLSMSTWPSLVRGRLASTVCGCFAVELFVFTVVRCASAPNGR